MKRRLANEQGSPRHGPTDWAALRERLARARAALAEQGERSPERRRDVLRRRSERIALAGEEERAGRVRLQVVEFRLAHETYAVDCAFVGEVGALVEYAPVPNAPAFVVGVTHVRGRMISIVDLRVVFGLPAGGLTNLNRLVVLRDRAMEFGLVVDAVESVTTIFADELSPPLPTLTGLRAAFCLGIAPGPAIVLEASRLLSAEEFFVRGGSSK